MKYIPAGMSYKEYEDRYSVRHIADSVALAYLVMLILEFGVLKYFFKFIGFFGINIDKISDYLIDPAGSLVINVLFTAVMFTIPFLMILPRENSKVFDTVLFARPKKGSFIPLFMMGIGACMAFNIVSSYFGEILDIFGISGSEVFTELPTGICGNIVTVLAVSAAPALLEEFAWRGISLSLLRRCGDGFAIFVSAAFFGLMHLNFSQIPFAFLVGIVIGFAYVKSNSIWTGCAIHFANNFISIVMSKTMDLLPDAVGDGFDMIMMAVAMIVGIFGLYLYISKGNNFQLMPGETQISNKQKFGRLMSSPLIIISLVASAAILLFLR